MLKKIINYLQYSLTNNANNETITVLLQVLSSIIEEAPEKKIMQNEFEKYDAIGMIILILSSTKHPKLTDTMY